MAVVLKLFEITSERFRLWESYYWVLVCLFTEILKSCYLVNKELKIIVVRYRFNFVPTSSSTKRSRVIWRPPSTFHPELIRSDSHRPTQAAQVSTTDASQRCRPIPDTWCRFQKVVAIRRSQNSASSAPAETELPRRSIWSIASTTLPRPAPDSGTEEVIFRAETRLRFSRPFRRLASLIVAIQVKIQYLRDYKI